MSAYGGLGPMLNGVLWMQVGLATLFVTLRLYTRIIVLRNVGWDDWFTAFSLVLLLLFAAFISESTAYGLGRRMAEIDNLESYVTAVKYEVIGQSFAILVVGISKTAVACFLLRIMIEQWHKVVLWLCIISVNGLSIFCTIAIFIQCVPLERVWNPTADGYCWLNFTAVGIATASWSVVMDFAMAVFPCFVVWKLNMKRKEKITVLSGLSLGVFAGVCGMVRTIMLTGLSGKEYLYDTVALLIWSATEGLVTIMCSSIPVLRPLYVRVKYGSKGDSSSNSRGYPLPEYGPNSKHNTNNGVKNTANSNNNNVYIGPSKSNYRSEVNASPGNSSEESILRGIRAGPSKSGSMGGIQTTHEVSNITFLG
ncbi:hypothetical protein F4775DRAFT_605054 [Biscogniauxia sp. FL1348]|nr:hypothetical protein F4775DRAFT_605054 [Biscogniauxia sp. FL1348]